MKNEYVFVYCDDPWHKGLRVPVERFRRRWPVDPDLDRTQTSGLWFGEKPIAAMLEGDEERPTDRPVATRGDGEFRIRLRFECEDARRHTPAVTIEAHTEVLDAVLDALTAHWDETGESWEVSLSFLGACVHRQAADSVQSDGER